MSSQFQAQNLTQFAQVSLLLRQGRAPWAVKTIMNTNHQPDAPESVRHWSGHDPSDSGACSECGGVIDDGRCTCNPCEIGTCEHFIHCDDCGRGMLESSATGFCFVCDSEWMAARPSHPESVSKQP